MPFSSLLLNESLLENIKKAGYQYPTPVQKKIIPLVLHAEDVICSAPTGTGKTAAFILPILELILKNQETKKYKKIQVLIVSPTRELATQIKENINLFTKKTNLKSAVIFGGTSIAKQKEILTKQIDILVSTPGRFLDLHKQNLMHVDFVEHLVIDEADLLLDLGFLNDVKKIARLCPTKKQTLLFSATLPNKIVQLAQQILINPTRVEITNNKVSNLPEIKQLVYFVAKQNKISLCKEILKNHTNSSIIIFRRTSYGVENLEKKLIDSGLKVDSLHGKKSQTFRQEAIHKFKSKYTQILIATDLAARGIDIYKLDLVINFDVPISPEVYVHRIGRTGRAKQAGNAITFCSVEEKNYLKKIQKFTNQKIPIQNTHPFVQDPNEKPIVHKSKNTGSKHKKSRKSTASKKKKKRWY